MITLGIETSCDDTSCGIVDDKLNVLANVVYSQIDQHRIYGGIVPEISSRAHLEKISVILEQTLIEANISIDDIDLFSFTRGPGLMGSLLVGAFFTQGLAIDNCKPIEGVNHLEGHLMSVHLSNPDLKPPFLCLTVSGGHTDLCIVKNFFNYEVIGHTRDDAVGEAFDKCGKILGLGYPAGPIVSKLAKLGQKDFVHFPRALDQKGCWDFSFSGLKTSFIRYVESQSKAFLKEHINDICASLENAIVDILVKKSIQALKAFKLNIVVICGGVSANTYLRNTMTFKTENLDFQTIVPDFAYCTDNGAMIASVAQMRYNHDCLLKQTEVKPNLYWF